MRKRRPWAKSEIDFLRKNYGYLSNEEIANKLNRGKTSIPDIARKHNIKNVMQREYAIYFDDEYHFTGTAEQCAKYLKVKMSTFNVMKSPVYRRRNETGIFVVDIGKWRKDES